jgi:hypothetical protein
MPQLLGGIAVARFEGLDPRRDGMSSLACHEISPRFKRDLLFAPDQAEMPHWSGGLVDPELLVLHPG